MTALYVEASQRKGVRFRREETIGEKIEHDMLRLKIFSAMTNRGADLLKDEIEDLGLQPAGKVGEAQKAVVAKAEELAARGEIVLPEEAR